MKLAEIYLDGFGHFHQQAFNLEDAPVTVFLGPNEAGKSTLLAFIRTILFGFPTRGRDEYYPPMNGGRHGGRISLSTDDGQVYVLERYVGAKGGEVTIRDGAGALLDSNMTMPLITGRASPDMFKGVFAFGLDELQQLGLLEDSTINDAIYSAGQGVRELPQFRKRLDERQSAIFSPRGRTQEIHKLLDTLRSIDGQLQEIEGNAARYASLTGRKAEIETDLEKLNVQRSKLTARQREDGNLIAGWDDWIALNNCNAQLSTLPKYDRFPENAIPRMESLEERVRQAAADAEETAAELKRVEAKVATGIPDEALLNAEDSIEEIRRDRGSFDGSVRDLPRRQTELQGMENRMSSMLADLGHQWSEDELRDFDLSIVVRDKVNLWRERLGESRARLRRAQERSEAEQSALRDRQSEVQHGQLQRTSPLPRLALAVIALAGVVLAVAGVLVGGQGLLLGAAGGVTLIILAAILWYTSSSSASTVPSLTIASQEQRLEDARKELEDASAADEEAQTEWQKWLREHQLDESLSPDGMTAFLGKVGETKAHLEPIAEMRRRIVAIERDIRDFSEKVKLLAAAYSVPLPSNAPESLVASADALISRLDRGKEARILWQTACAQQDDAASEHQRRENQAESAREDLAELLALGGTDDPEEFRRRARHHDERQELDRQSSEHVRRLELLSGPAEKFEEFSQRLAATDKGRLEEESNRLTEKIREIEEKQGDLRQEQGGIDKDLEAMVSEEKSSHLRLQRESTVEQLQDRAREWAKLEFARELLNRTSQKFEKDRQPSVVQHAQGFFSRVTGERYKRVYVPSGEQTVTVEDSNGAQKRPLELSRGTREQLFLALRFGLIMGFGEHAERLPVVVDEVLVNFDPERARLAMESFALLSKTNQVLVFTFHPDTAKLFEEVTDAQIIEIA